MDLMSLLVGAAVPLSIAAFSFLGTKVTATAQKKTAEVEARGPEWSSFLDEVRKENQRTKDDLNGRIDRLQTKVQRLEDKIAAKDRLIERKDALIEKKDQLLHLAMSELARFVRKFPDDAVTRSISYEIKDEMSAYWPRDEPEV